jgi:uncharacterized protein
MVGRDREVEIFDELMATEQAKLVILVGRRRVGKTFLINELFKNKMAFSYIGTYNATKESNFEKFTTQLHQFSKNNLPIASPSNWFQAFNLLSNLLTDKSKKRKVIFFDEFPWIDSHKSNFLNEFSYWWNNWASKNNVLVIICGSAASWMIKNIVRSKGGLHNRVSLTLTIEPFTLTETEKFFQSKRIELSRHQLIQIYMVTGGIPFYLEAIKRGDSPAKAIHDLCFTKNGILAKEYETLYRSLFDNPDRHLAIIAALSTKWMGLTRQELIDLTKLPNGGSFTNTLYELQASGFILEIPPMDKQKKETIFRLIDEFSLFYHHFMMKGNRIKDFNFTTNDKNFEIWSGYAFENICIKHSNSIKVALGISGIKSSVSSYYKQNGKDQKGLQIDMLLDRSDNCINLFEIKFYNGPWQINQDTSIDLLNKRSVYKSYSKTKKTVFITTIAPFGLVENDAAKDASDLNLDSKCLFN